MSAAATVLLITETFILKYYDGYIYRERERERERQRERETEREREREL